MGKNIKKRKGEVWENETYYFYCPTCEKPYNINYDASTRKEFDGIFEENTCFVKEGKCRFCKANLYVSYDVEYQGMVAYDMEEELRFQEYAEKYDDLVHKLEKVEKKLESKPSKKLKKKRKELKSMCKALEKELLDMDQAYEEKCLSLVTAREIEESVKM